MKADHSPVIYSTSITKEIRAAFQTYLHHKRMTRKTEANAAYHNFASLCEKNNKHPLAVADQLINEQS